MKPCFALLVQYCIVVPLNLALAKLLLTLVNHVVPTITSVDSAHYTVAALIVAWLLPKLYDLSKQIRVEVEVKKLGAKSKKKGEVTGDEEAKKP